MAAGRANGRANRACQEQRVLSAGAGVGMGSGWFRLPWTWHPAPGAGYLGRGRVGANRDRRWPLAPGGVSADMLSPPAHRQLDAPTLPTATLLVPLSNNQAQLPLRRCVRAASVCSRATAPPPRLGTWHVLSSSVCGPAISCGLARHRAAPANSTCHLTSQPAGRLMPRAPQGTLTAHRTRHHITHSQAAAIGPYLLPLPLNTSANPQRLNLLGMMLPAPAHTAGSPRAAATSPGWLISYHDQARRGRTASLLVSGAPAPSRPSAHPLINYPSK